MFDQQPNGWIVPKPFDLGIERVHLAARNSAGKHQIAVTREGLDLGRECIAEQPLPAPARALVNKICAVDPKSAKIGSVCQ